MSPGHDSLSRKIRWIFILQALVASLLVSLGTLLGSLMLRETLLEQRILQEAAHVWDLVDRDPHAVLPQSAVFDSYFVPAGVMPDEVPPDLRSLSPGLQHTADGEWRLAYVSERDKGRVYLRMSPGLTDRIVFWISVLAVALSVAGITLISWLGYRRCKRIVAPVTRLTRAVLGWNPGHPQLTRFDDLAGGGESTYEVTHLGAALNSMSQRMLQYVERERDFTRDASHELRTPVTVVRMASDLLASESLTPLGERSLRRIRQASRDMETLIDAFLLLARHPDVPVEVDDIRVQDVVHEQAANAGEWLEGKPVALEIVADADPVVRAPPRVLGVVVSELLRNACQFTAEGSVRIEVHADRVEVHDTGIGMDETTMARVFTPFYRADIADHTTKGMGLTMARRLADRMGWAIRLQSTPGHGTVAAVEFA